LVGASDPLDLEGEGVTVEAGRRDHPGGLVASVHRKGIGAHPTMIPPEDGKPCAPTGEVGREATSPPSS